MSAERPQTVPDEAPKKSGLASRVVDSLQQGYNDHRAPELMGTPQVSRGFFYALRNHGARSAWNYLVRREGVLGNSNTRPEIKAAANLFGSVALVLGVRELSKLSDEELGRQNHKPLVRARIGQAVFKVTLGLLFFAQEGEQFIGYPSDGDWSEHRKASRAGFDEGVERGEISGEEADRRMAEWDRRHGH